jgi:hypothetical protein
VGKFGWAEENGLKCNMTCNGNSSEICGGVMANSVYYTPLMQTLTTKSLSTLKADTFALTSKQRITISAMDG